MSEQKTLFLRRASGIVRAWNVFDGFIYAIYADSIFVATALTYGLSWAWPEGNIPLSIVLNCLAVYPVAIVYGMLASTMARVGGDYVWQTRALGGFWGYVLCITGLGFWPWMYAATNVFPGTLTSVAPVFSVLGGWLGNKGMINLSTWLTTTDGTWWAYVAYCGYASAVLAAGMKWYAKIQRWSFYIGCAAVVGWVVMFAVTSHQDFVNNFNWYMSTYYQWGGSNPYQYVIDKAVAGGYSPVPLAKTTLFASWQLVPVMSYVFAFVLWTGGMSGEIGGIQDLKKSTWMYVGSNTFAMIVCAGTMYLTLLIVGNEFFSSANFVWYNLGGASAMPITPFIGFLYITMTRNPLFWIITLIGFNAWFWIWPTNNWVQSIRMIFAASFDRALPGWVGAVNRRAVPLNAIITVTVGSLIMGWLWAYTVFARYTLDVTVGSVAAFVGSTLAGTLMPYLKRTRAMWEASPASKYKVAGVPVITIAGILGIVFYWIPTYYFWITDARYGVNDPLSGLLLIGSFVAVGVLYYAMKFYRKRQGIDMGLLYREIPYE